MKEKIKIKTIVCCLMMTSMLLGLGACNNEDDVMEIFNNKTWKLVRIATEKGKEQFYQGLWSNESKEEIDRELNTFRAEGNYTLNFNCAEVNGEVTGTVNVHAVNSRINDAVLKIEKLSVQKAISWLKYSSTVYRMCSNTKGIYIILLFTSKTEIQQKSWDLQPAKYN